MSTSPRRTPATEDAAGSSKRQVQPFPYQISQSDEINPGDHSSYTNPASIHVAREAAQEAQRITELRNQIETEAQKKFEEQLVRERSHIARALASFTRDRAVYFEKIEGEVVQLALSIARKILHREAQLDPLLLAGIVRVALEKIDKATGVILRVHPQNASDWRKYLAMQLDPADLPEIVEDQVQPLDVCVLETTMGVASFGLDIQLKEIEQGLMDLLAARPGTQP